MLKINIVMNINVKDKYSDEYKEDLIEYLKKLFSR